ncbi:hypothetical protein HK405_008095, partial [Cladochytrium tenue]
MPIDALPDLVLGGEILERQLASYPAVAVPRGGSGRTPLLLRHARQCRRVCRRWRDLLERVFWRRLTASPASFAAIVRTRMADEYWPIVGGGAYAELWPGWAPLARACWQDAVGPALSFWRGVATDMDAAEGSAGRKDFVSGMHSDSAVAIGDGGGRLGVGGAVAGREWAALVQELHVWVPDEASANNDRAVGRHPRAFAVFLAAARNLRVLHCAGDYRDIVAPLAVRNCRLLTSLELQPWCLSGETYKLIGAVAGRIGSGTRSTLLETNLVAVFPELRNLPQIHLRTLKSNVHTLVCPDVASCEQLFCDGAASRYSKLRHLAFLYSAQGDRPQQGLIEDICTRLDRLPPCRLPVTSLSFCGRADIARSIVRHLPFLEAIELNSNDAPLSHASALSAASSRLEYVFTNSVEFACAASLNPSLRHLHFAYDIDHSWDKLKKYCQSLRTLIVSYSQGAWLDDAAKHLPLLECFAVEFLGRLDTRQALRQRLHKLAECVARMPQLRWLRLRFHQAEQPAAEKFSAPWVAFLEYVSTHGARERRGWSGSRSVPGLVVQTNVRSSDRVWSAAVQAGIDLWPPSGWIWPAARFEVLRVDEMAAGRCPGCTRVGFF